MVVEGFLDKFRPIFGKRMDQSVRIMERWVRLEHEVGGVRSLVLESGSEIAASVGIRLDPSDEAALAGGLWQIMNRNLGVLKTFWATTLLSYPRYNHIPAEAYIERLVVAPAHRRTGMGLALLREAEALGRESGKQSVGLHVGGTNLPALRLYEDAYYEEISRQKSFLTGRFLGIREWIYLRKPL